MLAVDPADLGFTVVEVLFALALTTLTALVTTDIVTHAIYAVRDAREQTTATFLAQQKLDELRAARSRTVEEADSPAEALNLDHAGNVEYFDSAGSKRATAALTDDVAFVRRWSVRTHASSTRLRVIRVLVLGPRSRTQTFAWGSAGQVLVTSMVGG